MAKTESPRAGSQECRNFRRASRRSAGIYLGRSQSIQLQPSHAVDPYSSHDAGQIEGDGNSVEVLIRYGVIMPDMRSPLFLLVAGAGFFLAMYQWVIAETIR